MPLLTSRLPLVATWQRETFVGQFGERRHGVVAVEFAAGEFQDQRFRDSADALCHRQYWFVYHSEVIVMLSGRGGGHPQGGKTWGGLEKTI
jgi:hypothetical protein